MRFRFLLLAALCSGCVSARPTPAPQPGARSVAKLCASEQSERWVDCALTRMSLREKAAQLVWPQIYGDYVPADAASWRRASSLVTEQKVGGVIMSVGSPLEIAAKLNALQKMSDLPLLVSADYEFGAGYRARGGYFVPNAIDLGGAVVFPPEMALGAAGDTALAYEQGRITALEGRALGVHIAFAPILDVNNNPANPVINTRSYGEDPAQVARLGAAFIHGLQEHRMIATGKHFPGHGDTGVNSHLALPVVSASRARLDTVELVPFRSAVRAGVGAIMTFHGSMPALDSTGAPGTLSKPVLTGLLRDRLRFEGLIVSDAMDMRGVLDAYGATEAAIRAVEAGADVLLQPVDAAQTIDAVVAGVTQGRYDEARLDRSVRRILSAKQRLGLDRRRLVDLDSARAVVGGAQHQAAAQLAAERSITLVKDSLGQLPLGRLSPGARVLSITYARRADLGAGVAFDAELRHTFAGLHSEFVNADDPEPNLWRLLQSADSAEVIVVSSYVSHSSVATTVSAPKAFVDFVTELDRRERHPIVVAMGNPYFLQQVPQVGTYLVGWGGFPVSQRAAARALLGIAPITGRLPISIPLLARVGDGQTRPALVAGAR